MSTSRGRGFAATPAADAPRDEAPALGGGVLRQRRAPALEAPELLLELRPRIALGQLVFLAVKVTKPFVVGHPCATRPVVQLAELLELSGGGGHVTSFPRIGCCRSYPGGRSWRQMRRRPLQSCLLAVRGGAYHACVT